ncbi:dimethyl sulfoxide reductase membrane subunit [Gammaproteobacteria bacterium]
MKNVCFREMKETGRSYWLVQGLLAIVILLGLAAAHHMETAGHWITGMNNQIVWGLPHVFAVFLIVTASGELNLASIASVFGKAPYKPLSRLSALVAIAHLVGGLMILVLDLGRPDRLPVAITNFNLKSIFTWNIVLYSGFIVLAGVYLWTMMERRFNLYTKFAGLGVFIWRIILTTGTGSIFGFLVARDAYNAAIMAPMFIILSFSYGTAIYLMTLETLSYWGQRPIGEELITRLKNLLGIFIGAAFYFFLAYHATNLYIAQRQGVEYFLLGGSNLYSQMFWVGQIFIGTAIPLALLYGPLARFRLIIFLACILVVIGGLAQMYVTIIGGQAYPLTIFPGYEASSSFFDGQVGQYVPTIYEAMLGISGFAVAAFVVILATRMLPFIPDSLADADIDERLVVKGSNEALST